MKQRVRSNRGVTCVETSLLLVTLCILAMAAVAQLGNQQNKEFLIVAQSMGGGSLGTHDDDGACPSPAGCAGRESVP